jgi:hypothetical protein
MGHQNIDNSIQNCAKGKLMILQECYFTIRFIENMLLYIGFELNKVN